MSRRRFSSPLRRSYSPVTKQRLQQPLTLKGGSSAETRFEPTRTCQRRDRLPSSRWMQTAPGPLWQTIQHSRSTARFTKAAESMELDQHLPRKSTWFHIRQCSRWL